MFSNSICMPRGKLHQNSNWLLGDHLGSTSMVADSSGVMVSEVRYSAFGEVRYDSGTMTTDYLYTGQREEAEIGLYYYVARWYDPAIGRFVQADSVVPDPMSAKGLDRYAYGFNNPNRYSDPTGHTPIYLDGEQFVETNTSAGVTSHISTSSSQYFYTWTSPSTQTSTSVVENTNNDDNSLENITSNGESPSSSIFSSSTTGNIEIEEITSPTEEVWEDSLTEEPNNPLTTNHENEPANSSTSGGSTCMGATAVGSIMIVTLVVVDIPLIVANGVVPTIPVIGPFVEVLILVPVDLVVADLHLAFAGLTYQGATKPCDEVQLELLPPWGFDE